jgi:hypothetical protein
MANEKKQSQSIIIPRFIFVTILILIAFFLGYIAHSEIIHEHQNKLNPIIDSTSSLNKNVVNSNAGESNVFFKKDDIDRYLSSNYVVSSYNWVSLLLVIATLVVTLLGWFLWINIIETKSHIGELRDSKIEFQNMIIAFREEKSKILEQFELEKKEIQKSFKETESEHISNIDKELQEANVLMKALETKSQSINNIFEEQEYLGTYLKKKGDAEDDNNRKFLDHLTSHVEIKDSKLLFKGLYLTQLYSQNRNTRLDAAFICRNFCTTDPEDIENLVNALNFEKDEEVRVKIKETIEFIKQGSLQLNKYLT